MDTKENGQANVRQHPLSEESRRKTAAARESQLVELTARLKETPENVGLLSRRGDVLFFLARFQESAADYNRMAELQPSLERSHWRRGIAWFYAEEYDRAAHQFEIYNSFDNVDRENGIWRFFSQYESAGREKARQGLLKYEKDDREPFPAVYRLFSGETTPEKILRDIAAADLDADEREKRLFYAQLYIGLNHAVEDRPQQALVHLREAVANTWGPKAGYGPHYMWEVGRLHYEQLLKLPPVKNPPGE
ncbi:MAG: hypothetical protein KDA79_06795 [Planctomycetaceae bacterium]|nr:hypothetical protein [Planctomycetaceae bacterium]